MAAVLTGGPVFVQQPLESSRSRTLAKQVLHLHHMPHGISRSQKHAASSQDGVDKSFTVCKINLRAAGAWASRTHDSKPPAGQSSMQASMRCEGVSWGWSPVRPVSSALTGRGEALGDHKQCSAL